MVVGKLLLVCCFKCGGDVQAKAANAKGNKNRQSHTARFLEQADHTSSADVPADKPRKPQTTSLIGRSSSLADIRSQARLESADGTRRSLKSNTRPPTKLSDRLSSKDSTLPQDDGDGSKNDKLAPWARARSHDTLSEMERKSRDKADALAAAEAAARKEKAAKDARERARAEEAASNASPLTTSSFEVEEGVTMGYHVMPSPAEREAEAKVAFLVIIFSAFCVLCDCFVSFTFGRRPK